MIDGQRSVSGKKVFRQPVWMYYWLTRVTRIRTPDCELKGEIPVHVRNHLAKQSIWELNMTIKTDLAGIVGSEYVSDDPEVLEQY